MKKIKPLIIMNNATTDDYEEDDSLINFELTDEHEEDARIWRWAGPVRAGLEAVTLDASVDGVDAGRAEAVGAPGRLPARAVYGVGGDGSAQGGVEQGGELLRRLPCTELEHHERDHGLVEVITSSREWKKVGLPPA